VAVSEPRVDQLTASQREALAAELAELEGPSRQAVVQAIKTAREHGDLSENFEYHAAKNEQGLLEARIRTLRFRLENSVLVDESMLNADEVGVGSRVEIEDDDGTGWRSRSRASVGPEPSRRTRRSAARCSVAARATRSRFRRHAARGPRGSSPSSSPSD
jgi:transcription elongation GreA/GreB family factor